MPLHSGHLPLIFTVRDNRSSFFTFESLSSSDLKDTWACIYNPGHINFSQGPCSPTAAKVPGMCTDPADDARGISGYFLA